MNVCTGTRKHPHESIVYVGVDCPLCVMREKLQATENDLGKAEDLIARQASELDEAASEIRQLEAELGR